MTENIDLNTITETPLVYNSKLSNNYNSNIFLKYENLLPENTFKYRLYIKLNKIIDKESVIVCYNMHLNSLINILKNNDNIIHIYCPKTENKIKTKYKKLKVFYNGTDLKNTIKLAKEFAENKKLYYVDIYNDNKILKCYNSLAKEIINNKYINNKLDYLILAGHNIDLLKSLSNFFLKANKYTKIVSVKLSGNKKMISNEFIFENKKKNIISKTISNTDLINGIVNSYIYDSYIIELTSAMSISVLEKMKKNIRGKNVVCIITDNNIDLQFIIDILNQYNKISKN